MVCVCLYVCVLMSSYLVPPSQIWGKTDINKIHVHMLVITALSNSIEYDVEALIMNVSSSWKGGKTLIYTHRFPGIFIGLAKCHYTAGGEVMNCNKL